jgi:hypothetical protein
MGMMFQLQAPGFGNPVIQQAPYGMPPGKSVPISIKLILLLCLISGLRGAFISKVIFPKKPEDISPSRINYKKGELGCQEILLLIITIYNKLLQLICKNLT